MAATPLKQWFSKTEEIALGLQSKALISLIDKAAKNSAIGDAGRAFDLLKRVLAIAPDNAEAQQLFDEIHRHRSRSKWLPAAEVFAAATVATGTVTDAPSNGAAHTQPRARYLRFRDLTIAAATADKDSDKDSDFTLLFSPVFFED